MSRKRAPWMVDAPPARKYPIVFAVLPWRGDGRYKLDQATRVYKTRGAADRYAANDDTMTLVVRELNLDSNQETIIALFREAYATNAPNLERRDGHSLRELTGIGVVVDYDTGGVTITNDQREFYEVVPDPKYLLRFIRHE